MGAGCIDFLVDERYFDLSQQGILPMTDAALQVAKEEMLRQQLQERDINDPHVLAAMAKIPRERFIPVECHNQAYADRALPIDCGQTISQPFMVALMTQVLELSGQELVLEIGTGSGYQAAILAELAREVISIERHAALTRQAGAVLAALGYANVTLLTGDEHGSCLPGQRGVAFDADDFAGQLRGNRRLVAAARADFQH